MSELNLNAALAKAKMEFREIRKNQVAKIQGKTKSGKSYDYSYHYADLSEINAAVDPALAKYGLSTLAEFTEAGMCMRLLHDSGEERSSFIPIPWGQVENPKEMGALVTYYRRYQKSALLDLATEQGDEKGIHQGNSPARGAPSQPETYSETPGQKETLRDLMRSEGITNNQRMREISATLKGVPVVHLRQALCEITRNGANGSDETAPPPQ